MLHIFSFHSSRFLTIPLHSLLCSLFLPLLPLYMILYSTKYSPGCKIKILLLNLQTLAFAEHC